MNELLHKRSFTAKHFQNEDGSCLGHFHVGHIHYKDGALKDGAFEDMDTTFEFNAKAGLYSMRKASYEAEIGLGGDVHFHNVDHQLSFSLPNPNKVQPVPSDDEWGKLGKGLIWKDIIQDGGHQLVQLRNGSLAKIFHFDTVPKSNVIEFVVDAGGDVQFKTASTALANLKIQSQSLARSASTKTELLSATGEQITFGTAEKTSWLRPAKVWNHRGDSLAIKLLFFYRDGQLWASKTIPQAFIDKTFSEKGAWLETDTSTSYYSGAGDGLVNKADSSSWSGTRDASSGSAADYTSEALWMRMTRDGVYEIGRFFIPSDTSGLGSGATVTDVQVCWACSSFDMSEEWCEVRICAGAQASTSSLSTSDYSAVGSTEFFGAGIPTDTTSYYAQLNANGRAAVNKTGWTKYVIRPYNDFINSPPPNPTYSAMQIYTSEMSGTTYDPYLSITYTVPAPDVPTLSSPSDGATSQATNVTLSWNAATNATSYHLQVSTVSNFASTVYDTSGLTGTSQAMSGLARGTLHYWKVHSIGDGGDSAFCTARSFTTVRDLSLAITKATFTLTGVNSALKKGRTVAIATRGFVETGVAVALRKTSKLSVTKATFTHTGVASSFKLGHRVYVTKGTFAEGGQSASLRCSRKFSVVTGAFTYTGEAVALKYRKMVCETGSFTWTGVSANLKFRHLDAQHGSFTVTSGTIGMRRDHPLRVNKGTFTLTGYPMESQWTHRLNVSVGEFVFTGKTVSKLWPHHYVRATPLHISLTGKDAPLTYSKHTWKAMWANSGPGFLVNDIVMTQRKDFNAVGAKLTVYRIMGIVTAIGVDSLGNETADIQITEGEEYLSSYKDDLEWVVVGNATTPARASLIYMSADDDNAPFIDLISGVDTVAKFGNPAYTKVRMGNLAGIVDANFGTLSGYGLYTDNVYLRGAISLGSATALATGAGLWADKLGNFRVGDPATNKTLTFNVGTGAFSFGSGVEVSWTAVTGAGKPADNATVGATWGTNIGNIPAPLTTPSADGLYVSASHLGFWYSSAWKSYLKSDGTFAFTGDANNYLTWNGSTLSVKGSITMTGGSISWANITAPSYGDITGTKPPSDADKTSTVIGNQLTKIDATGVYTGTLTASQVNAAAATVVGALTSGSLTVGTTDKLWLNDSGDGGLAIGGSTKASAPFRVTSAGALTATSVTITGKVTSSDGTLTGASTSMVVGNTSKVWINSGGDEKVHIGGTDINTAPFNADSTGVRITAGLIDTNDVDFSFGTDTMTFASAHYDWDFDHDKVGFIASNISSGNFAIFYSDGNNYPSFYTSYVKIRDGLTIEVDQTPSASNDTGVKGQIKKDTSYIYICTATNTWKRVAISTW